MITDMTAHKSFLESKTFELAGDITLNLGEYSTPNEFIKTSLNMLADIKDHEDVVYIYLVDNKIAYVGESGESFAIRFKRHINGVSQKKSIPSRERWRELLKNGGVAQIYIHKCTPLDYLGESVSPRVGLESALITKFNPPLNSPKKAQIRKMTK